MPLRPFQQFAASVSNNIEQGDSVSRFLIFYLVAYGGSHLYLLLKLSKGLGLGRSAKICLTLPLFLLFIAPITARTLESAGFEKLPELLSPVGYLWMGLLFLFVTAAAAVDIINAILYLARRHTRMFSPASQLLIAVSYAFIVGIYGWHEAKDIRSEKITLRSPKIPAEIGRLRIVQLSDVHVGQIVSEERVSAMLDKVRSASPDIIVITGDLVDGHQRHLTGIDKLIAAVNPQLGKYAIMGNHEYYAGAADSINFMKKSGLIPLINENVKIGDFLFITGVDDSGKPADTAKNQLIERKLLDAAGEKSFRILLKHRPVVTETSKGRFDLQLSGHVHKGQIFPFNYLTWMSFPVKAGLTELDRGGYLYVSRGTGVWGPPIRFLAPPEVTVIDLLPAQK